MSPLGSHILSTKLLPPARLSHAIDRPRLVARVASELPPLVLVIAAAGFGKTTLVAQCHERTGTHGAWLSLDRNDRDPFIFVRHLIASLNRNGAIVSPATESFVEGRAASLDVDHLSVRMANDLEKLDDHRVLFLDDYHLAESPGINDLVDHLVNRATARLHVVITSRTMPALPVARYRADNIVREVGARELRFNHAEAQAFMAQTHALELGPRELDLLLRHTEGWGAGLQLASLFLKDSRDPKGAIHRLSGDTRDIADYLAMEVLQRQPPEIQRFLLHSSILDRMNADVCHALMADEDAQAMLERIEALGLFLIPLDAKRRWYRYHHLFRDFLRTQLRRQYPQAVPALYRLASTWFAQAGLQEEAVNMALDADDFDYAAQLVEQFAISMIKHGHVPQLARWIQRFPAHVLEQNPRLPLYQCWAVAHMAQVHHAERLLQRAEAAVDTLCQGSDDGRPLLQAEIHTLRAIVALMADDIERTHALASVRFPDTPDYTFLSGCLNNVAALAALARGEFAQAIAFAALAGDLHARSDCGYGVCYSRCTTGLTHLAQGRLSAARDCFTRAIDGAVQGSGERSFNAAMPRVLMALLHYEANALDAAYAILEDDLPLVDECAYVDIRTGAFLAMAGILGARGRVHAALAYLDQAITINVEAAFERTCALANSESIRLRLLSGDVAGTRRFARHSGIDDAIALPSYWARLPALRAISQCRLLIAEGDAAAAIAPLQSLVALAKAADRRARKIQLLSLLIVAFAQTRQHEAAVTAVQRVLALGAEEGFIRSILDQGAAAGDAFIAFSRDKARTARLPPLQADYLARICTAVKADESASAVAMPFSPGVATTVLVNGIAESLTDREMRVWRLVADGASNTQIGSALFISINTVRWHVANILSKLHVENRTQAAAAARALGLVP